MTRRPQTKSLRFISDFIECREGPTRPPIHSTRPRSPTSGGGWAVFVNLDDGRSNWIIGIELRISSG